MFAARSFKLAQLIEGSKLGSILRRTYELAALERLEKSP